MRSVNASFWAAAAPDALQVDLVKIDEYPAVRSDNLDVEMDERWSYVGSKANQNRQKKSEFIKVGKGRQKGTTKATPERAKALQSLGLTAAEIANTMAISKRTVFRYLVQE